MSETPPPAEPSSRDGWGDPSRFLLALFLWVSATLATWQGCEAKRDRQRVEEQLREIKALIEKQR